MIKRDLRWMSVLYWWCLLLFHSEGVCVVVHLEDNREWILKGWVMNKFFLLLLEKLVADLTFNEGCVSSTELLFACCSLRNVSGVKLGKDNGM